MKNKIKSLSLFLGIFLFLSITPSLFESGDAKAVCTNINTGKTYPTAAKCREAGGTVYTETIDDGIAACIAKTPILVAPEAGTLKKISCRIDKDSNMLSKTICNALGIVKGKGGKAFAAFAVIAAGIGFFSGKISWGLLIGVTCGIAIMFGSATIVTAISGSSSDECP